MSILCPYFNSRSIYIYIYTIKLYTSSYIYAFPSSPSVNQVMSVSDLVPLDNKRTAQNDIPFSNLTLCYGNSACLKTVCHWTTVNVLCKQKRRNCRPCWSHLKPAHKRCRCYRKSSQNKIYMPRWRFDPCHSFVNLLVTGKHTLWGTKHHCLYKSTTNPNQNVQSAMNISPIPISWSRRSPKWIKWSLLCDWGPL